MELHGGFSSSLIRLTQLHSSGSVSAADGPSAACWAADRRVTDELLMFQIFQEKIFLWLIRWHEHDATFKTWWVVRVVFTARSAQNTKTERNRHSTLTLYKLNDFSWMLCSCIVGNVGLSVLGPDLGLWSPDSSPLLQFWRLSSVCPACCCFCLRLITFLTMRTCSSVNPPNSFNPAAASRVTGCTVQGRCVELCCIFLHFWVV